MRDIDRNLLDFRTCIGRTAWTTTKFHHLIIRNIIAHVEDFLILQSVLFFQGFIFLNLYSSTHMDFGQSQAFVTLANGLRLSSCNDSHHQSALHGKLQGITVLNVHRTHRLTIRMKRNGLGTQHTVHIKDNGLYLFQVVVYHNSCILLLIVS